MDIIFLNDNIRIDGSFPSGTIDIRREGNYASFAAYTHILSANPDRILKLLRSRDGSEFVLISARHPDYLESFYYMDPANGYEAVWSLGDKQYPGAVVESLIKDIAALRKHLSPSGEYSITKSDKSKIGLGDSLILGQVLEDISAALEDLGIPRIDDNED